MRTPDFFRARLDGMLDLHHPLDILPADHILVALILTRTASAKGCLARGAPS